MKNSKFTLIENCGIQQQQQKSSEDIVITLFRKDCIQLSFIS